MSVTDIHLVLKHPPCESKEEEVWYLVTALPYLHDKPKLLASIMNVSVPDAEYLLLQDSRARRSLLAVKGEDAQPMRPLIAYPGLPEEPVTPPYVQAVAPKEQKPTPVPPAEKPAARESAAPPAAKVVAVTQAPVQPAPTAQVSADAKAVLKCLSRNGLTVPKIAAAAGLSIPVARRVLEELVAEGLAVRDGDAYRRPA